MAAKEMMAADHDNLESLKRRLLATTRPFVPSGWAHFPHSQAASSTRGRHTVLVVPHQPKEARCGVQGKGTAPPTTHEQIHFRDLPLFLLFLSL